MERATFIEQMTRLVALPVVDAASRNCKSVELRKIVRQQAPYEKCGFLESTFAEDAPPDARGMRLRVALIPVQSDYVASICVPNEKYATDLFSQYNVLKQAALAFWSDFCANHAELIEEMTRDRPGEWTLKIDTKNPTTMFFDAADAVRIGVLPYYVDAEGRPLVKK